MVLKKIVEEINSKTSNEWNDAIREALNAARSWVQDNAELAALIGFLSGILMVLFYRIFAWAFLIIFIWAAILWLRMPEE
jgi:hypothetical protein